MKTMLKQIFLKTAFVIAFACTAIAQHDGLKRLPQQYDMPFSATTLEEAQKWQNEARQKLFGYVEVVCPRKNTKELPLDMKIESTEELEAYMKHHISYMGNEGERKTAYLTIPKGKGNGPFPGVVALHGHGGNADAVFDPKGIYKAFADDFAKGDYVVIAPSLEHRTYAAEQLWNLMRLVDILESHPQVDKERLGVGGLSMGGEWTMWLAACDVRMKAAVVSGWMCTTEGALSVPNCVCWELPGMFSLMDVCEINILIAPRPVVFESSRLDPCFPINYCREGYVRIREGYAVFGAQDDVWMDTWDAGHEWSGELAYPVMDAVLKGNAREIYQEKKQRK
jgi:dienelactone hydrolase